jgi:hypothetical protein
VRASRRTTHSATDCATVEIEEGDRVIADCGAKVSVLGTKRAIDPRESKHDTG